MGNQAGRGAKGARSNAGDNAGDNAGAHPGEETSFLAFARAETMMDELAQLAGGKVVVERLPEAGDRETMPEYIGTYPASQYDLEGLFEHLATAHDGGKFKLQPKNGTQFAGAAVTVRIKRRKVEAAPPAPSALSPATWSIDKTVAVLTAASPIVTAILGRPLPPAPAPVQGMGVRDVLELMTAVKDGSASPDLLDQVEKLQRLKDLLREPRDDAGAAGAGDREKNWFDLADSALKAIANAGAQARPAIAAPATTPASSPEPDPSQPTLDQVKRLLELLVAAAEGEAKPKVYAQVALDMLGADNAARMLSHPQPLALLNQVDPRVSQNQVWFEKLLAAVRGMLPVSSTPAPGATPQT